jgi:hypothetical protein
MVWPGTILRCPEFNGLAHYPVIPDNSHIVAFRIKEPNPLNDDAGAIYIWADTRANLENPEQVLITLLNPKTAFGYQSKIDPRTYKLPYSRQMHKAILKARKQMAAMPGSQMRIKNGSSKRGNPASIQTKSSLNIEIINPVKLLP